LSIGFAPALTTALGRRSLRPFWLAQVFTYLAQQAWATILLWALWRLTHSAPWLAVGLVAQSLPVIAVGIAGPGRVLAGRPLAALSVGAAAILAAAALAARLAGGAHTAVAFVLLAAALAEGTLAAAQVPRLQASLAASVHADSLAAANAAMEFASRLGLVAGPALAGGALGRTGVAGALAATALCALVAAPAVAAWERSRLCARANAAADRPGPRRFDANAGASLFAGLRRAAPHVLGDPYLRTALTTRAVNNLLWPAVTLGLPLLVTERWHGGAFAYGLLVAARGLGSVGGTAVGARLRPHALGHAFFAAWLVEGAAFVGLGLSPALVPALVCALAGGMAGPLVHVALDSHIGRRVAAADRAAVFALQRMVMSGVGLAGSLGAGAVLAVIAPAVTVGAIGVAVAACAVGGWMAASRAGALAATPP
jgi:hypothetical protein